MNYKQIDEQFDEKFGKVKIMSDNQNEGIPGAYIHIEGKDYYVVEGNDDIKSFLHQIYDQAKAEQREEDAKVEEKYNELIMAVGNKYPGETRHKTALRYIKNAENSNHTATAIRQEGE